MDTLALNNTNSCKFTRIGNVISWDSSTKLIEPYSEKNNHISIAPSESRKSQKLWRVFLLILDCNAGVRRSAEQFSSTYHPFFNLISCNTTWPLKENDTAWLLDKWLSSKREYAIYSLPLSQATFVFKTTRVIFGGIGLLSFPTFEEIIVIISSIFFIKRWLVGGAFVHGKYKFLAHVF